MGTNPQATHTAAQILAFHSAAIHKVVQIKTTNYYCCKLKHVEYNK